MAQSLGSASMFRRGGTPTAVPSLETSNQTQIDDLVKRNRILEQTNKKLTDQLNLEQHRTKDIVTDIQKQIQTEQKEWREGCDILVSCHRLAHLRTIADLEAMETKVLQEEEARRREKVQRLQRDTRITMFQIREGELEAKVTDLEDERQRLIAHYEEAIAKLRQNLSTLTAERKAKTAELSRLEREREQVQDKLSQLRQEHATLQTSAESSEIKLERMSLQLDGAQTKITELERTCDEQKRSNLDLQRQLDKWKTLETKGNGELETLRKQKMALEVKISTLQDRLDKQCAEKEKELEKFSKRDEKFKDIMAKWQNEAEDQRSEREKADDALAEAQKRIKQLETELKNALPSGTLPGSRSDEGSMTGRSQTGKIQPTNKRSRSPPRSNRRDRTDDSMGTPDSPEVPRKAKRGREKSKLSPVSEVEEVPGTPEDWAVAKKPTKERNNPIKASKKAKGKAKILEVSATEDDAEDVSEGLRVALKPKRRRKAPTSDDDDVEIVANKPAPAKKDAQQKGRRKEGSRGAQNNLKNNADASAEEGDSTAEQAPTRKKRKINIFSNPAEPTFAFMGNDVGIGLNIPTTLSPVKESGIPNRSASVMSRIMSKSKLR